jgi:hypothetical protein
MAKFFVGQRVRCIRSESGRNQGREGRVIAVSYSGYRNVTATGAREFFANGLRVDHGWALPCLGPAECWEPITPPHVAGSWEVIEQLLPNIREGVAA